MTQNITKFGTADVQITAKPENIIKNEKNNNSISYRIVIPLPAASHGAGAHDLEGMHESCCKERHQGKDAGT